MLSKRERDLHHARQFFARLAPAQTIRLAIVGGGLGYLLARYWYLPDQVTHATEAGRVLAWQSISSSTAVAVLIGAIFLPGLGDMAGRFVQAVRFMRERKRREQDFLIRLGDTKQQ